MSTFYLLPPRPLLGDWVAGCLRPLFPGLDWSGAAWTDLADTLAAAVSRQPDVYLVFREELPDGEDPARALADGFGAEADDEVIEVRAGSRPGEWTTRHWMLGETVQRSFADQPEALARAALASASGWSREVGQ